MNEKLPPLNVERELVGRGFCWDRPPGKPFSFAGMPPPKKKCADKRKRKAPADPKALHYRIAQRHRWLLYGIVKPKDDVERAWLAAERARMNEEAA